MRLDTKMMELTAHHKANGLSARAIAKVLTSKRRKITHTQVLRWLRYEKQRGNSYPQENKKVLASGNSVA